MCQGQISFKKTTTYKWALKTKGPKSNSSEFLYLSWLPATLMMILASIKRIGSKTTEKRWRHRFPHYKSMGAFCCHGNQSFDPICPKKMGVPDPEDTTDHGHVTIIMLQDVAGIQTRPSSDGKREIRPCAIQEWLLKD